MGGLHTGGIESRCETEGGADFGGLGNLFDSQEGADTKVYFIAECGMNAAHSLGSCRGAEGDFEGIEASVKESLG